MFHVKTFIAYLERAKLLRNVFSLKKIELCQLADEAQSFYYSIIRKSFSPK